MKLSPQQIAKCLELAGEKPVRKIPAPPAGNRIEYRSFGVLMPGLVVVSEANTGGGLRAKIGRKIAIKANVLSALKELTPAASPLRPPYRVHLHRLGKKLLDDDNLAHAFKAVRDRVAEWLGLDDGDTDRIVFAYSQEKSKTVGIKITIEEV